MKTHLFPVKKSKKVPVKNKSGREKGQNMAKKWAWKKVFAREKIEKKPKKAFHGHFFFHGKKKTLASDGSI